MADATNFYRNTVSQVTQFIGLLSQLEVVADRMAADGSLAAAAAAAANSSGRTDLTATDFSNLQAAIVAIQQANVGNVKAFFYKVL